MSNRKIHHKSKYYWSFVSIPTYHLKLTWSESGGAIYDRIQWENEPPLKSVTYFLISNWKNRCDWFKGGIILSWNSIVNWSPTFRPPEALERINSFYMLFYGKNWFGFRTFRFSTNFQERIKFENRGSTVYERQLRLRNI